MKSLSWYGKTFGKVKELLSWVKELLILLHA